MLYSILQQQQQQSFQFRLCFLMVNRLETFEGSRLDPEDNVGSLNNYYTKNQL